MRIKILTKMSEESKSTTLQRYNNYLNGQNKYEKKLDFFSINLSCRLQNP